MNCQVSKEVKLLGAVIYYLFFFFAAIFCKNLYLKLLTLDTGKILWNYVKPLIRGRILYTPDNEATRKIIQAVRFIASTLFLILNLSVLFF